MLSKYLLSITVYIPMLSGLERRTEDLYDNLAFSVLPYTTWHML